MIELVTDLDGIIATARTMASAQKKAKAHADAYNETVYISKYVGGDIGCKELGEIKPTKEVM